ncbi:MAG: DUF4432 domain-containing protein [Blastopirellula sp.]|nr:MAG: DUF4432 domain-containing protein [Blastopirellula sp.]
MATKSWTLLDVQHNIVVDTPGRNSEMFVRDEKHLHGSKVEKYTKSGGLSDGVDVLHVVNGEFEFRVLPTRGMNVWDAFYQGTRIGWHSPIHGPVHPKYVPVSEPSGLGWLDGFDELFVRCGLESNGAPEFDEESGRLIYPLHGRIGNKPANKVEVEIDDEGEITIRAEVLETRFHFLKLKLITEIKTKPGEIGFRVHDTIENLSAAEAEAQILYHVNFGDPMLDAGSQVMCAAEQIVPRNEHAASAIKSWDHYQAPTLGFEEMVYFFKLRGDKDGNTQTLLKNAHSQKGASLIFNTKQLPCFTLWKDTGSIEDGYVTGLEPGSNFPNPRTYEGEQGRVVKLAAKGSAEFDVQFIYHPDEASIAAAEAAVGKLSAGKEPKIFDTPQTGWCA